MDIGKLLERFGSKKIRPLTAIVIAEVMLFLFSIETLIEWFNIHPIVFFSFFVLASFLVFSILQFIKQPQEEKSWIKAIFQMIVFVRTTMSIIVFFLLFVLYVILIVPEYRVIAITDCVEKQFTKKESLKIFTKEKNLNALSIEIKALLGNQYRVKIDNNVTKKLENSRLIIVPGIFDKEKAVETLIKLEERIEFFQKSDEETEIPYLSTLWKAKGCSKIEDIKAQIGFMGGINDVEQISWSNQQFNKFKFIINF
jgi:hypothetical protein